MASPILICLSLILTNVGLSQRSDDWEQPTWGSIRPTQVAGEFVFQIDEWPDESRLSLPSGFPQVVAVTMESDHEVVFLDISIDRESSTIAVVPPDGQQSTRPSELRVLTCESSHQMPNGVVAFSALDAVVEGEQAELESDPGNHRIGFWSRPDDQVQWRYEATRWGKYEVFLTYSNASPQGSVIKFELGGEPLEMELKSTGDWYRYRTDRVGVVYFAKSGPHDIKIACNKLVGGAVMNVKSIILKPACEGENPIQSADGTVILHGRDATVHGTMLRYEPAERKRTLGYWVKAEDAASWDFTINEAGEFDVEVLQGCGTGNGGSEMRIKVSGQSVDFIVEDTGHFQNFKPRIVGQIRIDDPGEYELSVQPQKIANKAACDIRQIRLLPR